MALHSYDVAGKLLTALGINSTNVKRLVIDVLDDDAVMVYIEQWITEQQIESVRNVLHEERGSPAIVVQHVWPDQGKRDDDGA